MKDTILKTQEEHMEKFANELYDFLETNEYFKKIPKFDSEVEWLIKERENCQRYSNFRILSFLNPPYNGFFDLCKQFDPFETFKKELDVMSYNLLAPVALSQYEALKRIFCIALDFEKIALKPKSDPTYGTLISKLKEKGLEKNIVGALDNKLRNIIAHGDWYVQNGLFTYIDNGKQTISYEELLRRIDDFTYFSNAFYKQYWNEYIPPEARKFSEQQIVKNRMNL